MSTLRLFLILLLAACAGTQAEHLCSMPDVEPLGVTQAAQINGEVDPLTFRRHASGGYGSGALFEAMECATLRIKTAVCIDIDLTISPYNNMVRWEAAANMPNNSSGYVTGTTWGTQRIKLSDALTSIAWCTVLTHEMIHVLRQSYSHPGPQYGMSYPVSYTSNPPYTKIIQDDIDRICAKQTCGCQVPEV